MERKALIERKTKETEITLRLDIDGKGISKVDTGIPFMDHMLSLMSAHGFTDLEVTARGDTEIDYHHTIEDLGICLGKAIAEALGGKEGIRRYGEATVPMDEALARVVLDLSNRPFLAYRVPLKRRKAGTFDISLIKEFFRSITVHSGMTLHIDLFSGEDAHHVAEAIFKAFGRALDRATNVETRLGGSVPSTKGVL
ncbi:MAG: imidazoleglycerol-phosphate dehydratase HisB [Deltaproteobacteria bacterium]|nr:imidazoleglycerol-phosphate dehydratase HisB [Deltaproteobacteria bacterium]MBW2138122.1 imidazoleglycerol-phosphate dehydratase HisB [Deltaproteobacteria bacterium]